MEKHAMADNLKKLAKSESFQTLQDKVTYWMKDYDVSPGGRPQGSPCLSFPAQPRPGLVFAKPPLLRP